MGAHFAMAKEIKKSFFSDILHLVRGFTDSDLAVGFGQDEGWHDSI